MAGGAGHGRIRDPVMRIVAISREQENRNRAEAFLDYGQLLDEAGVGSVQILHDGQSRFLGRAQVVEELTRYGRLAQAARVPYCASGARLLRQLGGEARLAGPANARNEDHATATAQCLVPLLPQPFELGLAAQNEWRRCVELGRQVGGRADAARQAQPGRDPGRSGIGPEDPWQAPARRPRRARPEARAPTVVIRGGVSCMCAQSTARSESRSNGGAPVRHLVEQAAERVDIGARAGIPVLDLLRGDVRDGAEHLAGRGERGNRR